MTTSTPFSQINSLAEFSFIGGTEFVLTFNLYDDEGAPIDISAGVVSWTMSPLSQPQNPVLTKSGVITDTNTFTVTIDSTDTLTLKGKFIHQPIFVDFAGAEFRPNQGIITIIPRIQNT